MIIEYNFLLKVGIMMLLIIKLSFATGVHVLRLLLADAVLAGTIFLVLEVFK